MQGYRFYEPEQSCAGTYCAITSHVLTSEAINGAAVTAGTAVVYSSVNTPCNPTLADPTCSYLDVSQNNVEAIYTFSIVTSMEASTNTYTSSITVNVVCQDYTYLIITNTIAAASFEHAHSSAITWSFPDTSFVCNCPSFCSPLTYAATSDTSGTSSPGAYAITHNGAGAYVMTVNTATVANYTFYVEATSPDNVKHYSPAIDVRIYCTP